MPPKKTTDDLISTIIAKLLSSRDAATLIYRIGLAFMLMFTWNSAQKTYDVIQSIPALIDRVDKIEKALKEKGIVKLENYNGN